MSHPTQGGGPYVPDLPQPGSRWSHFRIDRELGRGGFGRVYQAFDLRLERPVAVKVLDPRDARDEGVRERFLREAKLAAALEHPHIITIYDADEHEGVPYIVMRYVEGGDLGRELADGPLPLLRTVSVIRQIAAALDSAHHHRVPLVHRDVKAANILCNRVTGNVYLTDFGITRPVEQDSDERLTQRGTVLGTVAYAAPEQIRGGHVDARTDVYALGCLLFVCLTGRLPFEGANSAVMLGHVQESPPVPSEVTADIPVGCDRVVATALAKDPERRFASCGELAAALDLAVEGRPELQERSPHRESSTPDLIAMSGAQASHGQDPASAEGEAVTQAVKRPGDDDGPTVAIPGAGTHAGGEGQGTDRQADGHHDNHVGREPAGWRAAVVLLAVLGAVTIGAWAFLGGGPDPDPDPDPDAGAGLTDEVAGGPTADEATAPAPSPSVAPPATAFPTADEQRLLSLVGAGGDGCRRIVSNIDLPGTLAGVSCLDPDQVATQLTYRLFSDVASRDAAFASLLGEVGVEAEASGDCSQGGAAAHAFQGAAAAGRVVCKVDGDLAGLSWTREDIPVLVSAQQAGADDLESLYAWWAGKVGRDTS